MLGPPQQQLVDLQLRLLWHAGRLQTQVQCCWPRPPAHTHPFTLLRLMLLGHADKLQAQAQQTPCHYL